jgi:hypothetical protein
MPMPRKAAKPLEEIPLWLEMNWSSGGPHGAAQRINTPLPCVICKKPSYLLSPSKGVPTHKVCAEEYHLVSLLTAILAAVGTRHT